MLDLAQVSTSPNGVPIYEASPFFPGYPVVNDAIAPMVINAHSTLSIPAYWRALRFLSENLASFPRSVHKDGAKLQGPRAFGRKASKKYRFALKEYEEQVERMRPVERLLKRQPNACQNATIFWRTWFFHAAHVGNGYAEVVRGGSGQAAGLRNLMPDDVCPFRYDFSDVDAKTRAALAARGIRIDGIGAMQFYLLRSSKRVLPAADVIHLQSLGYDGMSGTDPTALHAETFQRAGTLNRFQTKYLQRGTVIRGAIEIPGETTKEQDEEIRDTVERYFRGPDGKRDVLVLSGGAKLNNTTISPQESQLIEQGAHVTKQIAQITGVPPQFLYEFGESKYNNSIEQMGQDVVRYTFRPWIEQAEDELTIKLLSGAEQDEGYTVRINPGALLRGSTKEQEEIVGASVKNGIRTRNEGRALLDLPPDTDPKSDQLNTLGDTNPAGARPAPETAEAMSARLNSWHVDAAVGVVQKLRSGDVSPVVATELLVGVGIARERAEAMVNDAGASRSEGGPAVDALSALLPVIRAACDRVDRKTEKAFANAAAKTGQERTVWGNVFAEEQAKYAADALAPVVQAMGELGQPGRMDAKRVADRYAAAIRRRVAGNDAQSLLDIIDSN